MWLIRIIISSLRRLQDTDDADTIAVDWLELGSHLRCNDRISFSFHFRCWLFNVRDVICRWLWLSASFICDGVCAEAHLLICKACLKAVCCLRRTVLFVFRLVFSYIMNSRFIHPESSFCLSSHLYYGFHISITLFALIGMITHVMLYIYSDHGISIKFNMSDTTVELIVLFLLNYTF